MDIIHSLIILIIWAVLMFYERINPLRIQLRVWAMMLFGTLIYPIGYGMVFLMIIWTVSERIKNRANHDQ